MEERTRWGAREREPEKYLFIDNLRSKNVGTGKRQNDFRHWRLYFLFFPISQRSTYYILVGSVIRQRKKKQIAEMVRHLIADCRGMRNNPNTYENK